MKGTSVLIMKRQASVLVKKEQSRAKQNSNTCSCAQRSSKMWNKPRKQRTVIFTWCGVGSFQCYCEVVTVKGANVQFLKGNALKVKPGYGYELIVEIGEGRR